MDAIKIGKYVLSMVKTPSGIKIWIQEQGGEGMEADVADLEKVIEEYFDRELR